MQLLFLNTCNKMILHITCILRWHLFVNTLVTSNLSAILVFAILINQNLNLSQVLFPLKSTVGQKLKIPKLQRLMLVMTRLYWPMVRH